MVQQVIKGAVFIGVLTASYSGIAATLNGDQQTVNETVSVEAAVIDGVDADIESGRIVLDFDSDLVLGNRVFLRVDNGAVFKDSQYVLEQSTAGAATGDTSQFQLLTVVSSNTAELEFRVVSPVSNADEYILSGSSVVNAPVNLHLPSMTEGSRISLSGDIISFSGLLETFPDIKIFEYFNEFSAALALKANAVIERLSNRTTFLNNATSDEILINFNSAALDNKLVLGKRDIIDISLTGNLKGVSELVLDTDGTNRGSFTIDGDARLATFRARASDLFAATSTTITANISGSEKLNSTQFHVGAELSLLNSLDKTLLQNTTRAGSWSYNGFEAKVSLFEVNTPSYSVMLNLSNESSFNAEVDAEILWTKNGGAFEPPVIVDFGQLPAGGHINLTDADIAEAIGESEEGVEAFITFTVTGATDQIHLVAEKFTSEGSLLIPVYYNIAEESFRSWTR